MNTIDWADAAVSREHSDASHRMFLGEWSQLGSLDQTQSHGHLTHGK